MGCGASREEHKAAAEISNLIDEELQNDNVKSTHVVWSLLSWSWHVFYVDSYFSIVVAKTVNRLMPCIALWLWVKMASKKGEISTQVSSLKYPGILLFFFVGGGEIVREGGYY